MPEAMIAGAPIPILVKFLLHKQNYQKNFVPYGHKLGFEGPSHSSGELD